MTLTYSVHSSLFSSRILFNPFDASNDAIPETNKAGIRLHNWLGAFVCNILAKLGLASGIVTATINGRALYLNRGSFKKWCERHESEWTPNENAAAKIQAIVSQFIQKQEEIERAKEAIKQERVRKIQEVALSHLQQMTAICYNADGQLNTELLKGHRLFQAFKRDTFFTKHEENAQESLEATIKDYPVDSQIPFYHGTAASIANKIKAEGFNPLAPTATGTDSGAGTYLTQEKGVALGYAKGNEKGLLTCRIKPALKIAHLNGKVRECFDLFRSLVVRYVKRNEEGIKNDCRALEIEASIGLEVEPRLWDLFVRDFFLRLGYRGLYTEHSGLAGCSYLNLFDPQTDIAEIK